jgi:hypothetical protein
VPFHGGLGLPIVPIIDQGNQTVADSSGVSCGVVSQADIARSASERGTAKLIKGVSRPGEHASLIR